MQVDDDKLSQLFLGVDSYIVPMTFLAEIRCYIPIFKIWALFGPKRPISFPHLSTIIMNMHVDDDKLSQLVVGVDSYMVSMTLLA